MQPGLCHRPPSFHGSGRHSEGVRRFMDRHASEEPTFDDLRLTWIELDQALKGVVQGDQRVDSSISRVTTCLQRSLNLIKRYVTLPGTSLRCVLAPCIIDQDLPHRFRGHRHEMRSVSPHDPRLLTEPQVGFVNESGRIEAVFALPATPLLLCQAAKLVVHEREVLVESMPLPGPQLQREAIDGFITAVVHGFARTKRGVGERWGCGARSIQR
jgi:hypothetical protein